MRTNAKLIKRDNEYYAKFYADVWNKEYSISIPLKTNDPILLKTRLNHVDTKGFLIFSLPIYQQKNPLSNNYYKEVFPWIEKHKEIKRTRDNKMLESELKRRRNNHKKDPRARLRDGARRRAIEKGIPFDLKTHKDLPKVPKYCPILDIPLVVGVGVPTDNSPSLDRIDNNKGYTKDNIQIISRKANQMKSNANFKEIELLYLHMKSKGGK